MSPPFPLPPYDAPRIRDLGCLRKRRLGWPRGIAYGVLLLMAGALAVITAYFWP